MIQSNEIIRTGHLELHFLLDSEDTNKQLVMFEAVFPAGSKVAVPPHFHKNVDEIVYVLEGKVTVTINGKEEVISAGSCCFIPRGMVHHLGNRTNKKARALGLITPGLLGASYFREIGRIYNSGPTPDLQLAKEFMLKHETVPVVQDRAHHG